MVICGQILMLLRKNYGHHNWMLELTWFIVIAPANQNVTLSDQVFPWGNSKVKNCQFPKPDFSTHFDLSIPRWSSEEEEMSRCFEHYEVSCGRKSFSESGTLKMKKELRVKAGSYRKIVTWWTDDDIYRYHKQRLNLGKAWKCKVTSWRYCNLCVLIL